VSGEHGAKVFGAIMNLVVLAKECEDKHEAIRHMARALILGTSNELTNAERDNLGVFLLDEVVKDLF